MKRLTFLLICAALNLSSAQDMDSLINQIFQTSEPQAQPSEGSTPPPQIDQPLKNKVCGPEQVCVSRFQCTNDVLNTNGEKLIDIRLGNEECDYLSLCCDIGKKTLQPINILRSNQRVGCGFRNPDGVGFRIIGDNNNEAQFGEFPWMVAILRERSETVMYDCGGALIAPNVILTAAHCVQNRQAIELIARAGEWDSQRRTEVIPEQDRRVREIIVHEQYSRGALYNDIALLITEGSFELLETIRPICLPPAGTNFDFSRCFSTGWGKNNFEKNGTYQVILKKIDLPIMTRDKCVSNLRSTRLGRFFELHESFVCAGGEKGKDTCKGDGGSPLVCPMPDQEDRFYQTGIVAWGVGCGEENVPGVYANVPHLRPWLDEKLASRGIDSSYYTP